MTEEQIKKLHDEVAEIRRLTKDGFYRNDHTTLRLLEALELTEGERDEARTRLAEAEKLIYDYLISTGSRIQALLQVARSEVRELRKLGDAMRSTGSKLSVRGIISGPADWDAFWAACGAWKERSFALTYGATPEELLGQKPEGGQDPA